MGGVRGERQSGFFFTCHPIIPIPDETWTRLTSCDPFLLDFWMRKVVGCGLVDTQRRPLCYVRRLGTSEKPFLDEVEKSFFFEAHADSYI